MNRIFFFFSFWTLLSSGYCLAEDGSDLNSRNIDELLRELPASTQSLIYARGPIDLSRMTTAAMLGLVQSIDVTNWWKNATPPVDFIAWYCCLTKNIQDIDKGKIFEFLKNRTITSGAKVVLGFVPDPTLENPEQDWEERSCNIVQYKSTEQEFQSLIEILERNSKAQYTEFGLKVFPCETDASKKSSSVRASIDSVRKLYEQQLIAKGKLAELQKFRAERPRQVPIRKILICAPRPGILFSSRDKSTLSEILRRYSSIDRKQVALTPALPEWEFVDKHASIFGIRHYDLSGKDDPTSPRSTKSEAGRLKPSTDPKAIGFIMNVSPTGLEYFYLSKTEGLENTIHQLFPENKLYGDLMKDTQVSKISKGMRLRIQNQTKSALSWGKALFWLGNK